MADNYAIYSRREYRHTGRYVVYQDGDGYEYDAFSARDDAFEYALSIADNLSNTYIVDTETGEEWHVEDKRWDCTLLEPSKRTLIYERSK